MRSRGLRTGKSDTPGGGRNYAALVDARPTSLIVSPMATATSTAVEAAIPTISERRGGDREERQRHQSEKP